MLFRNIFLILGLLSTFALAAACSTDTGTGSNSAPLSAVCTEEPLDAAIEWLCPEELTVECEDGAGDPEFIHFWPAGDPSDVLPEGCDDVGLTLGDEDEGPFDLGTHEITVTATASGEDEEPVESSCVATLHVVDSLPPEANDEPIELWPPNHKYHTITAEDCVKDLCDEDVQVTFHWASSDEPANDKGDGNTEPDIVLDCDRVQLRAERQGPSNGRVYRLGWTAVDGEGNETEEEQVCVVTVPHDQSGREAIDDGEESGHRVEHEDGDCDDGTGGAGGAGGAGGDPIVVP